MTRLVARGTAAAVAIFLGACGGGSSAEAPARTIEIAMRDISFLPSTVAVKKGERVRFVFTNAGTLQHEAFIGEESQQDEHEDRMAGMHHGTGSGGVTVKPGKSGAIETSFHKAGEQIIGCHEPGHYTNGMKIIVTVE